MMLDEFEELKREATALQRAAAVAEGLAKGAEERLRGEFGVTTPAEEKALLARLKKKERAAADEEAEAKAAYLALREQHKDEIQQFLGDDK